MLQIFRLPELRKKIIFSVAVVIVFRLLAHIPVPGVDIESVRSFLQGNALLNLFDLFSGGGFQNFSIVTLGLGPYINASIIMQLFTVMIPKLEELSKEGESGRERINQYTKYLMVPLSCMQAYGVYFLLNRQGVITTLSGLELGVLTVTLAGGTALLTWVGDLVSEYGVGNGISLLIFVGIISRLPVSALKFFAGITSADFLNTAVFLLISLLVIAGVVFVNEGTRNIPLEYGRRGAGVARTRNYLPVKINQAGVIPIIFAVSMVLIPSLVSGPLQVSSVSSLQSIGTFLAGAFSSTSFLYNFVYFLLVVGFTYFYTSVQFDPDKIADDIKKRGGFIPGIRPGKATARYLRSIITKLTLFGGIFLGLVAILPYLIQTALGLSTLAIGGTGLLIVVSVVLETIRQVESMIVTRSYDSFIT